MPYITQCLNVSPSAHIILLTRSISNIHSVPSKPPYILFVSIYHVLFSLSYIISKHQPCRPSTLQLTACTKQEPVLGIQLKNQALRELNSKNLI